MSEELKPVRCGCGGEAKVESANGYDPFAEKKKPNLWYGVICRKCKIQTKSYYTEAEAITAWNKAMGERTAKAKVNFKDENFFFGWCECGQYQSSQYPYCPACGARLEWK